MRSQQPATFFNQRYKSCRWPLSIV